MKVGDMVEAVRCEWGSSPGWAPEGAIGIITKIDGKFCTVLWLKNNTMPNGRKMVQTVSPDMEWRIKVLSSSKQQGK